MAEEIRVAANGARAALRPTFDLPEDQIEQLIREIGAFVKLTGGGWPTNQRQEFIDQAAADLADIPPDLLAPAVRTARQTIYQPARFVSWIRESVAEKLAKLEVELRRLENLEELAKR